MRASLSSIRRSLRLIARRLLNIQAPLMIQMPVEIPKIHA
jgi:hypothetical protein